MKINCSYILLKEIRCYAYHGVAPQENLIGNDYLIDLKLKISAKLPRQMKLPTPSTKPKYIK